MFIRPHKPEPTPHTRQTLEEMGFAFDSADGILRSIATGERYDFDGFSSERKRNVEYYNSLTDPASREVYSILTGDDVGMEPIPVPDSRQPHCNIYATRGALESQNLVVIVTGHGVRAGVWAWNVLVKQGLRAGSVIEYIKDCVNRGFGVLVLNPNENIVAPDGLPETFNSYTGKSLPISGSETPNEHVGYVWRHIIRDSKAESVTFVAYNTAGIAVADLLQYDFERFAAKVSGVAFIDSLHSTFQMQSIHVKWLEMAAKQWITSADPAGEQVSSGSVGCVTVSAGNDTDYRELTPFVCKTLVIDYISDCFDRGQIVSTSDSLDAGGQFEAGTGMDPTPDDDGGAFGGAGGLESVQMVQDIHSFDGDGYIGWE